VSVALGAQAGRRRSVWPAIRGWLFVGPVVLGTLIFNVLPLFPTVYASFTTWNGLGNLQWVGLANYQKIFAGRDPVLLVSLKNTIIFTIGYVPVAILVGLGLALLANQQLRGIVVFRALFFLPVITSVVAVGIVWRWIFSSPFGVMNWSLAQVGVSGPRWLGDPVWAMIAVILVSVWQVMGYNMVILLAGLQGVPQELLEAASIDGAGRVRRFWHITVPLLTPTIFFLSIIAVINSFQVFGLIYVMTGGGPGSSTNVYVYYLWKEAFQLREMGYAAAMSWLLFLVILVITLVQWRLAKRWVHYQ
jgi:multiple sugar transport system permease protein